MKRLRSKNSHSFIFVLDTCTRKAQKVLADTKRVLKYTYKDIPPELWHGAGIEGMFFLAAGKYLTQEGEKIWSKWLSRNREPKGQR